MVYAHSRVWFHLKKILRQRHEQTWRTLCRVKQAKQRRTHSQLDVEFSGELRSESGMGAARGSGVKEQHGEVLDTG